MADNKNPSYIDQLKEMRALRTQQLRGMNADQRFYANMNSNQRALLQANQKLAASFDSMSKTFVSGIKGLTNAVGGLASKGASAAGNVAGGALSLAGSITSGLGKVLPFAIAGLVGKMLVWDNLTSDNKNRLTSSVARLFSNLFGDLPDMFKGIVQRIIKSVSNMDIKFPIITTLMQKTETFIKMFSAGIELAKLKFEDLMEFFEGIKDPMKIFESGLKAMGAATLARLLLPATVSLVSSIIGNRLLMRDLGNVLDSSVGGRIGGGVVGGATGRRGRTSRVQKIAGAAGVAGGARVVAGKAAAARLGLTAATSLGIAIPVFGQLALAGYTIYELYQIAAELGFDGDAADELSNVEPDMQTNASSFYGETRLSEGGQKKYYKALTDNESINSQLKRLGNTGADQITRKDLERKKLENQDIIDIRNNKILQEDEELKMFKGEGNNAKLTKAFFDIWNIFTRDEKLFHIENNRPVLESDIFVYFYGKDGQIVQIKKTEYLDTLRKLPEVEKMSRDEFERMTGKAIKQHESAGNYNAVYGMGKKDGSILPPKKLTEMTGDQVLAYQEELRKATAGKIGQGDKGTSAVGAYQLTKTYVTDPYYAEFPEEKGKLFNEEQQDKIYRWFIKDAVDKFMVDNDIDKFKNTIIKHWEAFKPKGSEARKQLDALLSSPVFKADAGTPAGAKQTKEQRAMREKLLMDMIKDASKETFNTSGDYRPVLIGGTDVAKEAVEVVKETAGKVRNWFTDLITMPGLDPAAASFFGLDGDPSTGIQMDPGKKLGNYINYYNTDNSVKVASQSGGGGGGSAPSLSVSSVTNKPYFDYYRFMAGGNPVA